MVTRNPDENKNPWLPVHDGAAPREAVAPSKPAMPAAPPSTPRPEPIEAGEAEVIAPVSMPPQEEILPEGPSAPSAPTTSSAAAAEGDRPYRALGDAAVRNASLAASGAPTPLGGVPRVPPPEHDSSPTEGPTHPNPFVEHPPSAIAQDEDPPYTPRVGAEAEPEPEPGSGDGDDDESSKKSATPWWRSVPALVIAGLIVMGAIGYGVYVALSDDEPVELTAPVVVVSPPPAVLDPIAIDDPSEFQSALPGVVGAYALTAIDVPAPTALGLEVRAAEASLMTYSDGEIEVTLTAIQHFDQEAAVAQFEALAVDGTDRQPVEAGGSTVGESAAVPAENGSTIVWRNGTAVFEVTGPADAVEALFAGYPL